MVQATFGSRGWAAMTNPKSDGNEPVISCHVAPPSSERYMPQWFCWYRCSGSPAASVNLWTHWPNSGGGPG